MIQKRQKFSIITTLALATVSSLGMLCSPAAHANDIYIEDDPRILRAYELICDNRLKIAKGYISNKLKIHKDNIHLLNVKAFVEVYLNNYKAAERDSNKVLMQDPDNVSALARRGFARLNQKRYKEGIADLNKLLSQVPEDYPNLLNRSKAHQLLGHKKEAARDYALALRYLLITDVSLAPSKEVLLERLKEINDSLDENPKDPYLFLARAKCFYRLKKFDSALKDASSAIIADPSVAPRARYLRAKVFLRRGNANRAIKDLTYVITRKPKIVDWSYFSMCPDNPKKKRWRRRIVRITDVYVERARAYSKQQSYKKAIQDCNTALKLKKNNINAILVRGAAYDSLKNYPKAATDYKTAVKLSNGRQDTIYMLSRSLQKLNQVSTGRTELLVSLATSLQDLGRHKEALNTVSKLLKTNPKDKNLYKAKIKSLIKLKRYWSAVTDSDKLIGLDPKDPESYMLRGDAETKLKEYRSAVNDYTMAMKNGGGKKARIKRAKVYKLMGKKALYEKEMRLVKAGH